MFDLKPYERKNNVTSYNPFRDMEAFERNFFSNPFGFFDSRALSEFKTDITDNGKEYVLEADLPGFRKEDISLTVKEDVLTVAAHREKEQQAGQYVCRERRAGDVRRSFDVSAIEQEGIRAAFENGVLVLTLPKASAVKPERRSISIQ